VRFSYRMVPEVYQVFWAGMAAGEFINDAAIAASSYREQGSRWLAAAGGVRPRRGRGLRGRCLTLAQREEIALGRARGVRADGADFITASSLLVPVGRHPHASVRTRLPVRSLFGALWRSALSTVRAPWQPLAPAELIVDLPSIKRNRR
jgi:hypothetical protein